MSGTYPSSRRDHLTSHALKLVAARFQVVECLPLRLVVELEQDLAGVFTVQPTDSTHANLVGVVGLDRDDRKEGPVNHHLARHGLRRRAEGVGARLQLPNGEGAHGGLSKSPVPFRRGGGWG